MGFLSDTKEQIRSGGRGRTKIDEIRKKMSPQDFREFEQAVHDRDIPCSAIARALKKRGIECASNTIWHYREEIPNDNK
jgi:hypothetical protein